MRILADEQFNELNEHIKQLEAENKYLKKLLDDAGIPYDKANKALEKNESQEINIKEDDDEMRIVNRSVAKALLEDQTIDVRD